MKTLLAILALSTFALAQAPPPSPAPVVPKSTPATSASQPPSAIPGVGDDLTDIEILRHRLADALETINNLTIQNLQLNAALTSKSIQELRAERQTLDQAILKDHKAPDGSKVTLERDKNGNLVSGKVEKPTVKAPDSSKPGGTK